MSRLAIEISALTPGNEDSKVSTFVKMYSRYAERQGWKLEPCFEAALPSGARGATLSESLGRVVAVLSGEGVYAKVRFENGVHRVQWVPPSDPEGRVLTSKVRVVVAQEGDQATRAYSDAEVIRTYNIPQNRLTDHRIDLTLHGLDLIMVGGLDQVIDPLIAYFGGHGGAAG
jgi:protein subunit release factor A